MEKEGLTARKAAKAVNVVFDQMIGALRRGETVEIPGGSIRVNTTKGKRRLKYQKFRDVHTRKNVSKFIWYPGSRRVVTFTPDLELDVSPFPVPEAPEVIE